MTYAEQTWADGATGGTPLSASRLNHMEDGIASANNGGISATTQAGAAYTLAMVDANTLVRMANASASTVTVPPNSSVAFPIGTILNIYAAGAGGVTIAAGAGVTIRNNTTVLVQYAECSLRKDAADEWVRLG